jgi:formylglycine-generating enzyme required for sulfatase activity
MSPLAHRVRWLLAALLLPLYSPQLPAQERPDAAAPGSGAPRAAVQPRLQLAVAPTVLPARKPAPQAGPLRRLAAGMVFRDCVDCPEMVVVPPGNLDTGVPDAEAGPADRDAPPSVEANSGVFALGKFEITRAQFARFAAQSGHAAGGGCYAWNGKRYTHDAAKDWRNPGFAQTDRDPVVCVNWYDAKAYAEWLSKKTGRRYRLPTEAEWEYAARAGSQESRPWADTESDACRYANVADASARSGVPGTATWKFHECDDRHAYTAPAGSYPPNAFGLHDMMGNAWEWTEGCWSQEPAGAPADGRDRPGESCARRVLRGGSWVDSPPFVLYDFRFFIGAEDRDFYAGFRVLRTD